MQPPTLREIAQRYLDSHEPIDWSGCLSIDPVSGFVMGRVSPEILVEEHAGGVEILDLSRNLEIPGENVLDVLVYLAQVEGDRESPPAVRIDWRGCDAVERVLGRMSGIPVLKGTRMGADSVVENFILGSTIEEIADDFGLDPDAVEAAIAHALRKTLETASPSGIQKAA